MNIYVVVEGKTESKVYPAWIQFVNPSLTLVNKITDVAQNNFYIVSGGGYPEYYEIIDGAIGDVNTQPSFDRLVIAIDSEDLSYAEKYQEVDDFVRSRNCRIPFHIVVQHFCLETWALGNQLIFTKHPQDARLRSYKNLFDVRVLDPELLPPHQTEELNRAQFAERYLRRALNEKYRQLSYSKSNPKVIMHEKYFDRIEDRCTRIGHVQSFRQFRIAFQ